MRNPHLITGNRSTLDVAPRNRIDALMPAQFVTVTPSRFGRVFDWLCRHLSFIGI